MIPNKEFFLKIILLEVIILKRWFIFFVLIALVLPFAGCLSPSNPEEDIDVNLDTYSSLDFDFLKDFFNQMNVEIDSLYGTSSQDGLVIPVSIKTIGKVVQMASKAVKNKKEKEFMETVVYDINQIITKLDGMETKMTASFNSVLAAISDASLSDAINSLNDHISIIDNGWAKYLGDYNRFTGEKLADGYLDIVSATNVSSETLSNETDYFINYISTDVENHSYQNAITAIRNMITQPLILGQFNILDKFVDSASLDNINDFGNLDTAEDELANYLTFYTGLMFYQIKATILMNEYANYFVDYDNVILEDDYYQTYDSDTANKNNSSLMVALNEQLTPYLNSSERLISQFNSGDIYRQYGYGDKIRNSDLYPFVDLLFGIVKNYQNFLIFRLVWSEEQSDFNISLTEEDVQFTLKNYYSENIPIDSNYTKTSTFKLYSKGNASDSFIGGVKRFVFTDVPYYENLTVSLQSENKKLTDNGCSRNFYLYFPNEIEFDIDDLINDNNPLENYGVNISPESASYTFGAFTSEITNSSYMYGDFSLYNEKEALKLDRVFGGSTYYIQYSHGMTTYPVSFSLDLENDDDNIINSGDKVKCWCKSSGFGGYNDDHEGYLSVYKKSGKGNHITVHSEGNDTLTCNVIKVNHTPSGILFNDDIIRSGDIFILEFRDGKSMIGDTGEKYNRLMENIHPDRNDTKNWLYQY